VTDTLTHEAFSEQLGTKFDVQLEPDKSVGLELAEISQLKQSGRQEQFSIVFRGPNEIPLEQGTHQISHHKFGKLEIFIVPISQDERGYRYQAIFNRLRNSDPASA
jgi:hypothetical protein